MHKQIKIKSIASCSNLKQLKANKQDIERANIYNDFFKAKRSELDLRIHLVKFSRICAIVFPIQRN